MLYTHCEHKRPTAIPNKEPQQRYLYMSGTKPAGSRASSYFCLQPQQKLNISALVSVGSILIPRANHFGGQSSQTPRHHCSVIAKFRSKIDRAEILFAYSKMLKDSCIGGFICFEFTIFCQHRIAQDEDKGEETKGFMVLRLLHSVLDSGTCFLLTLHQCPCPILLHFILIRIISTRESCWCNVKAHSFI